MELDTNLIVLLISTGVVVGIINTFAGAAAAISISMFMALGMPITVANGTNRIPVLAQTLVMSVNFARQGVLDYKVGLRLAIPAVVGSVIGSFFASWVDVQIFSYVLTLVLLLLLVFLVVNPRKIINDKRSDDSPITIRKIDYLWFFIIGLYGGAIHIGVGYLILAVTMMHMGYDVITANALKGFVVLMYVPFALGIFMYNDQVVYSYGIVHAIGNIIGAFIATQFAGKINKAFIRWLLIVMIIITMLDINGIISIKDFIFQLFDISR